MNVPNPDAAGPPASQRQAEGLANGGDAPARRTGAQVAKDIGLFFAAPYVTLAQLAMFPFLGMKLLAQLWRERKAAD